MGRDTISGMADRKLPDTLMLVQSAQGRSNHMVAAMTAPGIVRLRRSGT